MKTLTKLRFLFPWILLVLFTLSLTNKLTAQYIIAGQHGANDYYAAAGTAFSTSTPPDYYSSAVYYIDINGDGINDFELTATWDQGMMFSQTSLYITAINNDQVECGIYDSCAMQNGAFDFILNDTISNQNPEWNSHSIMLAGATTFSNPGGGCYYYFDTTNTAIIGARLISTTDTLYGWIRVSGVFSYGCNIIDYACNSTTKTINSETPSINIYPNPTSGVIIFQIVGITQATGIEVYNSLGQRVYIGELSGTNTSINLSNNTSGVYFYRILTETNNIVSAGKFVIQN